MIGRRLFSLALPALILTPKLLMPVKAQPLIIPTTSILSISTFISDLEAKILLGLQHRMVIDYYRNKDTKLRDSEKQVLQTHFTIPNNTRYLYLDKGIIDVSDLHIDTNILSIHPDPRELIRA